MNMQKIMVGSCVLLMVGLVFAGISSVKAFEAPTQENPGWATAIEFYWAGCALLGWSFVVGAIICFIKSKDLEEHFKSKKD